MGSRAMCTHHGSEQDLQMPPQAGMFTHLLAAAPPPRENHSWKLPTFLCDKDIQGTNDWMANGDAISHFDVTPAPEK